MDIKQLRKLINEVKQERLLKEESSGSEEHLLMKVLVELSPQKIQELEDRLKQKGHRTDIAGATNIIRTLKHVAQLGNKLNSISLPKPADEMVEDPQFKSLDYDRLMTYLYDEYMLDSEKYFHPLAVFLKHSAAEKGEEETPSETEPSEVPGNSTSPDSPAGRARKNKVPLPVDPNATTVTRKR